MNYTAGVAGLTFRHTRAASEEFYGVPDSVFKVHFRFPIQHTFRPANVWLPNFGVVHG